MLRTPHFFLVSLLITCFVLVGPTSGVRAGKHKPNRHRARHANRATPHSRISPDSEAFGVLAEAAKTLQTKLAVEANNLANAETVGFKRSIVVLETAGYRDRILPGIEDSTGQYTAEGVAVGMGVRVAAVHTDFSQGPFCHTTNPLDLAIEGDGFFQVTDPASGEILYSRAGNFSRNANGAIVLGSSSVGRLLEPAITIPEDALSITVSNEGIVSVRQPGSPSLTQVGQIELARFVNPSGLRKLAGNLYAETDASGTATVGNPGQDGLGTIAQHTLEASNVNVATETVQFTLTGRTLQTIRRLLQVE
ncbi:MAG: flagellar hook-basal body complex protein [Planctomycetes bacterium]|nr:flagellar hook-basal body complex protein [Planctomycetota bacterium]